MSRHALRAALGVGLATATLCSGFALGAPPDVRSLEIGVIHATRVDGGTSIDPRLRDLPQLTKQQPFIRYNAFKLLDRRRLPIDKGKPVSYGLVDGRTLQVTLVDDANADANDGEKHDGRYHLRAEIGGPGNKEFLKLLEVTAEANEPFFVGGQAYQGGTLFLELVVR